VLESLQELEKLVDTNRRRGIKFEDYLAARSENTASYRAYAFAIKETGRPGLISPAPTKMWSKLLEKYRCRSRSRNPGEVKNGDKGPQVSRSNSTNHSINRDR